MVITMAEGYGHLAWVFGTDGYRNRCCSSRALGAKRQQARLERAGAPPVLFETKGCPILSRFLRKGGIQGSIPQGCDVLPLRAPFFQLTDRPKLPKSPELPKLEDWGHVPETPEITPNGGRASGIQVEFGSPDRRKRKVKDRRCFPT
jgi:hypothetical protein